METVWWLLVFGTPSLCLFWWRLPDVIRATGEHRAAVLRARAVLREADTRALDRMGRE